jgi:sugar O-acyltransferase (sialic acid O-acetyltransferase NeuD family)
LLELIIVGAGGLGREVLQWVKDINAAQPQWHIKGFIDDSEQPLAGYECSHSVIGTIREWKPAKNEVFVCAIANPKTKEKLVNNMKLRGFRFISVIHPTAIIGDHNTIGEGLIMYPNARITVNTRIGNFVTLLSAAIGHDAQIGDYTTISSACVVAGNSELGQRVFLGTNSVVIDNIRVADDAFIGAGSVVIVNVGENSRVIGNPARPFLPKG